MKYTTWLKLAIGLQLATALVHALSFLNTPVGTTDQEKMLIELMYTYRMDLGAGYHRTMHEIVNALSACFSLIYFFGGVLNIYLLRQKADPALMKGIFAIELVIFGFAFALMVIFTFLPPIVLTGLVFVFLFGAWVSINERVKG